MLAGAASSNTGCEQRATQRANANSEKGKAKRFRSRVHGIAALQTKKSESEVVKDVSLYKEKTMKGWTCSRD